MKIAGQDKKSKRLHERIGLLMVRGQYRSALELLDKLIEGPLPLFQGEAWVTEERRLAWLYRIDLLRERDRLTEALAWACLEVEMNPDNVAAVALKERLKREAGFLRRQGSEKNRPASDVERLRTPWDGVAGMRDLKAMLERDVILPLQEPEIYAHYRLNLPNGILLYGPPGCGKTFIARKLAAVAGFSFIEVKPGDLASVYVHGTQGKISELFAKARKQAPCMIFFDELDAMVPNRDGNSVGHHYASDRSRPLNTGIRHCMTVSRRSFFSATKEFHGHSTTFSPGFLVTLERTVGGLFQSNHSDRFLSDTTTHSWIPLLTGHHRGHQGDLMV